MKNKILLKKAIAVLLAFIIVFTAQYYLHYESNHFVHECTGIECPICHELQVAETMLSQIGGAILAVICSFLLATTIRKVVVLFLNSFQKRTLILDKVRLDD